MLRSEEEPAQTTIDLGPAKEIQHSDGFAKPAQASPVQKKKKLQFHMASKIQIIPNNRQGQLNTGYIPTIPGVLKVAEIILAFVGFILAICADRRSTTAAWTEHVTFETMIVVSALLCGYVCFPHLTIRDEPTREGLIVVELIFYGINTLFYFISIWLMVHLSASWGTDGRGAAIMTAVICVALTIIFAIETFLKLKAWRGENEPSIKVVTSGEQPSQG
uniref:MARVEL domain-containing protein n=1 Tax=Angiostrongylus cantonensis TaxID=6313 RepID=A0A0K0CTX7_ANGCA